MRRLPSLLTQLRAVPKSTRFSFGPSFRTRVCLADRGHTGLRPRTRSRCKCNNQADEKRHREQNRDSFHGSALRITHRKPTGWLRHRPVTRSARRMRTPGTRTMSTMLDKPCGLLSVKKSALGLISAQTPIQGTSRRTSRRSSWTLVQLRKAKPRPPPREATGDGEEGGCRLARVHEAGKPQWILWSVLVCTSRLHVSIGPWSNIGEVFRHEPATTRVQMHVCEAFFSFRAHAAGRYLGIV